MGYNVEVMPPAVDFIHSLSPKLRAKALRAIELLKEFGFRLGEPHSKTLVGTDGLKELRVKVGTDICRIFYFHHKGNLYVATSGYIKKKGSPHILVKPLFFNTPSGYTHIEFATVK